MTSELLVLVSDLSHASFLCFSHPLPHSTDDGKLPFMAMLRNLCNLLRVGISAHHHELVLQRLQQVVFTRGRELGGPATRGGCGDAAAALKARLFLVAGEGYGCQAISMWAENRCADTDRLGKIGPGVHQPFEKLELSFLFSEISDLLGGGTSVI